MRVLSLILVLALCLISPLCLAADNGKNIDYLVKNKDDLTKIENYLENIKYLTATFVQKSPDGQTLTGKFYLSRPGKMRIEYNRPSPILIVANGNVLIYQDLELEEISYLTTNSTPASFLTREKISFSAKDVEITNFKKDAKYITVSVEKKNRKEAGEFTLTFEANPINFVKMEVKNDLDQLTTVSFIDTNFGNKIDSSLFVVKDNKLPN